MATSRKIDKNHDHYWSYVHAIWEGDLVARYCIGCGAMQAGKVTRWGKIPKTHPDIQSECERQYTEAWANLRRASTQ